MRPLKQGLDYFPFDVDFFYSDKKIKVLKAKYGCDGITVYIYLLCQIYKNGYFIKLDEDCEYIISDELKMEPEKIGQIINFLCGRSLFDNKLFVSDKVLSSRGIQARFQAAVKERGSKRAVEVDANIWLLGKSETESYVKFTHFSDKSENNPSKSEKNEGFSQEKVHKEKERKENKSIVKENKELAAAVRAYEQNIGTCSATVSERIAYWLSEVNLSLIEYAIEQAARYNKQNWNYIETILKAKRSAGQKTREAAEAKKAVKKKDASYELDDMAAMERKMRLAKMNKEDNNA